MQTDHVSGDCQVDQCVANIVVAGEHIKYRIVYIGAQGGEETGCRYHDD